MADQKITDFSADASPAAADLVVTAKSPFGAGSNRKVTLANMAALVNASPTITGHATIEGVTATGATGTGKLVFDGTPTLVTPVLGAATATSIVVPTLNGGTAANDDITIQGTTDSTRTTSYVNLQPNGGYVGIGTAVPIAHFHTNGANNAPIFITTSANSAGNGTGIEFRFNSGNSTAKLSQIMSKLDGPAGDFSFNTPPNGSGEYTTKMYISNVGNVGIGTTSPAAVLHLKAGTATASTAPLKFTTGTALTTPEAGTMEYNSGRLTFTDTDAARRHVVQAVAETKTTAAAPYTNDGYIEVVINGANVKLMTCA